MNKILKFVAAAATLLAAVGCQSPQPATKPTTTAMGNRSVLNVQPIRRPTPTYAAVPSATPPEEPTAQPVVMAAVSETPAEVAPDAPKSHWHSAGKGKRVGGYQVKKGDTLYRIAKTHYGDPKKWTQIASANPGLSPQTLKVGQTIILP